MSNVCFNMYIDVRRGGGARAGRWAGRGARGHATRHKRQAAHTHTTHARLACLPLLLVECLSYASADTRSSNASSALLSSRNCSSDTVGIVRLRPRAKDCGCEGRAGRPRPSECAVC